MTIMIITSSNNVEKVSVMRLRHTETCDHGSKYGYPYGFGHRTFVHIRQPVINVNGSAYPMGCVVLLSIRLSACDTGVYYS